MQKLLLKTHCFKIYHFLKPYSWNLKNPLKSTKNHKQKINNIFIFNNNNKNRKKNTFSERFPIDILSIFFMYSRDFFYNVI